MTLDPESASLLVQAQREAQRQANGLDVSVTTDGRKVEGEAAVAHTAERWWVRAWAKVTAKRGAKPQTGAGVTLGARWFGGWDR